MLTELVVTSAAVGLAVGASRRPDTQARLFEGLGWVAIGFVFALVFR